METGANWRHQSEGDVTNSFSGPLQTDVSHSAAFFYGGRVSWSPFKRYSAHLRGPLKPPFGSEKTNTKSTFYSKRNISAITSAKDTNSAILAAILTLRDPQAPTTFNTYTCPSSRTQDFESTPNDPKLVLPPPPIDPHPSIPVASCHLVSKRPIRVRV